MPYFEGGDGLEPDLEAKQLWLDARPRLRSTTR